MKTYPKLDEQLAQTSLTDEAAKICISRLSDVKEGEIIIGTLSDRQIRMYHLRIKLVDEVEALLEGIEEKMAKYNDIVLSDAPDSECEKYRILALNAVKEVEFLDWRVDKLSEILSRSLEYDISDPNKGYEPQKNLGIRKDYKIVFKVVKKKEKGFIFSHLVRFTDKVLSLRN